MSRGQGQYTATDQDGRHQVEPAGIAAAPVPDPADCDRDRGTADTTQHPDRANRPGRGAAGQEALRNGPENSLGTVDPHAGDREAADDPGNARRNSGDGETQCGEAESAGRVEKPFPDPVGMPGQQRHAKQAGQRRNGSQQPDLGDREAVATQDGRQPRQQRGEAAEQAEIAQAEQDHRWLPQRLEHTSAVDGAHRIRLVLQLPS